MSNRPFVFGVAVTGDNFTGREKETARLAMNFEHGVNTILISPRRWGKTSLVKKVAEQVSSKERKVVYLDVFACRTEQEFYVEFASAVIRQTSSVIDEWLDIAKSFLSRLSPRISFGTDSIEDFSMSLEFTPKMEEASDILSLPQKIAEKKGIDIVVCIDEFQQIGEFKGSKEFQKRLRGVWQHQDRVCYCLFGSKRHLMSELFESRSLPFYRFGDTINLPKIPADEWSRFIVERFEATGKSIDSDVATGIAEAVSCHSFYVQQLAWLVWVYSDKAATSEDLDRAMDELLMQNTPLYEEMTERLTAHQMSFLRAMLDGHGAEMTTGAVIKEYGLQSSANVVSVRKALVSKELIEIRGGSADFIDPVFRLWLMRCKP